MEKKIEDYLHLYLGCEVYDSNPKDEKFRRYILSAKELGYYENLLHTIKPILRPLNDMTEEENEQWAQTNIYNDRYKDEAAATTYLLSKHFDLFGLIEAGLAIEKNN